MRSVVGAEVALLKRTVEQWVRVDVPLLCMATAPAVSTRGRSHPLDCLVESPPPVSPGELSFSALGGGGGGFNRAPNTGGLGKRAPLTGPSISYYEFWRRNFLSIVNAQISPPNIWRMMTFLNPLDVLIPKSHFHFLTIFFGVWFTSRAQGSVSVGFWGGGFFGEGGLARGLYRPLPPPVETLPTPALCASLAQVALTTGGPPSWRPSARLRPLQGQRCCRCCSATPGLWPVPVRQQVTVPPLLPELTERWTPWTMCGMSSDGDKSTSNTPGRRVWTESCRFLAKEKRMGSHVKKKHKALSSLHLPKRVTVARSSGLEFVPEDELHDPHPLRGAGGARKCGCGACGPNLSCAVSHSFCSLQRLRRLHCPCLGPMRAMPGISDTWAPLAWRCYALRGPIEPPTAFVTSSSYRTNSDFLRKC